MERTTCRAVMAVAITFTIIGQAIAVEGDIRGNVGYIAGNTVYVDVGWSVGLGVNDTLSVVHEGEVIGKIVVINAASDASSCSPLFPITDIRVGDEVLTAKDVSLRKEDTEVSMPPKEPSARRRDRFDGSVSLGSVLSDDLTDSGLGFSRPSLGTRFRIRGIAGKPLTLDLRHRSRYYGRESRLRASGSKDRWTHQIYRFSLTYQDKGAPYQIRLGRFLPSMPRGIGYVDGLLLRYRLRDHLDFGVVGGFRPDDYSADFRFDEKTVGAFSTFDVNLGESDDLELSMAFTGNYRSGTVDREFFVSEGYYSRGGWLSASGSVEIDLNRGWKGTMGEKLLDITRFFAGSRYRVADDLSLNLSYDSRRLPRTIENRTTPDSLFDDSLRRGFHAGVSWSASPTIQLGGSAGVRIRDGVDNTISASGSARIREFPMEGLVTRARFATFRTMFSRGYRPSVELGLKPASDLTLDVRAGDTVYDTGGRKSHDPWINSSLHYWLNRRQSLTIHFNGHLSERLRSARLSGETGIRF